MKALLLAAGLGTRLKPLTDSIPKCLIKLNAKPLSPKSVYTNAGIAVVSKKVYSDDYKTPPFDFARDIMPHLIYSSYVLLADKPIIDIDTLKDYNYVQNLIKTI